MRRRACCPVQPVQKYTLLRVAQSEMDPKHFRKLVSLMGRAYTTSLVANFKTDNPGCTDAEILVWLARKQQAALGEWHESFRDNNLVVAALQLAIKYITVRLFGAHAGCPRAIMACMPCTHRIRARPRSRDPCMLLCK